MVGTTIFTIMSKLANDCKAINLSQGFPDFNCSDELISLVNKYMKKGHNQYGPMQGIMPLREVISEKMNTLYGRYYDPDKEINITSGGTQAICASVFALVHRGDEVIIFEPAYDCYAPTVELCGGIPVFIKLKLPDYHIDWNEVKTKITSKTKVIMINTPHNPTGAVLSKNDMLQLQQIITDKEIFIISDEVYEHIIFDNTEHQSIAMYPELAMKSFIIFSFGKIFHTTGWKTGYCMAPDYLMAEFRKVHQFMVFCANTPIQHALTEFFKKEDEFLGLSSFYQKKRDFFNSIIKNSRLKFIPASGSYFQSACYDGISAEKDTDFAIRLTKEVGVASIPTSVFYHDKTDDKILRFCFAKTEEVLQSAAEKLCKI